MDEITKLKQRVQGFVISGVLTKKELAARAGMRDTTIIPVLSPSWNPTTDTLARLIRAIDKYESDVAKKKARHELRMQRAFA